MGAHWSSCPVGDSTSVKPSSHMHMAACRGQHTVTKHSDSLSFLRRSPVTLSPSERWHHTTERLALVRPPLIHLYS
ncbi:hypothetical protein EYF80_057531 [Liparis tanakae]|uniref:Uncharacterized protein n=1 Tax=Liparis tanakae TaxID=230148 RepID=A0A4Z2EUJ7_9TELE|nr:hypothetical protein EYF80_057531 [Liparis tanakae]